MRKATSAALLFVVLVTITFNVSNTFATPFVRAANDNTSGSITWNDFSDRQFERAKSEKKLLLLNLEAVWCHWCHVMEKETYADKLVQQELTKGFISMRVDQDARPDLSVRFSQYGWPATIIFAPDGTVLRALSGYQDPKAFLSALTEVRQNPAPKDSRGPVEVDIPLQGSLSPEYRESLISRHSKSLDKTKGGLRTSHRFLDADTVEYALVRGSRGDSEEGAFAKLTLTANLKLLDPVWGGVYQYSTHSDWNNPHYEKIMSTQADNIRLYSFAYSLWGDEAYWNAATSSYLFLKKFLTSPEGAFYTSQDADVRKGEHSKEYFALGDVQRRAQGVPTVDTHIYSRENGLAISALASLYAATGNRSILDDAKRAATWILTNRARSSGGLAHGEADSEVYLGDNLAMAEATLAIYAASGERSWLSESQKLADAVAKLFGDYSGEVLQPGYFTDRQEHKGPLKPLKTLAENIRLARYFNLLFHYTGIDRYREYAKTAMRYIATPGHASENINDTGILLADIELTSDPLHITIVGAKDDALAGELFKAGLRYFSNYKRIEWWDKREGAMPNPDVEYPQMQRSAAFICTNKRCSLPIFKAEGIADTIKLFHKDLT